MPFHRVLLLQCLPQPYLLNSDLAFTSSMDPFPAFLPTFPSPSLPLFQLFSYYSTLETWNETRRGALHGGEDRVSVPYKPLGQVQSYLAHRPLKCLWNE